MLRSRAYSDLRFYGLIILGWGGCSMVYVRLHSNFGVGLRL